jgi:hypothetical protein
MEGKDMNLRHYEFTPTVYDFTDEDPSTYNVRLLDPIHGIIDLGTIRCYGEDKWGAWPELNAEAFVVGFETKGEVVAWLGGNRNGKLQEQARQADRQAKAANRDRP